MANNIRSEAKNSLEGYLSTHTVLDADMADAAKWREAAADELKSRQLGVVKAFSDDLLAAIVNGEIDMSAVYAAARDRRARNQLAA